jgi:hypothetical protein
MFELVCFLPVNDINSTGNADILVTETFLQEFAVPHNEFVLTCMYRVLLFVGVNDSGPNPTATTAPLYVPLLTVIQSVATVVIAI